MTQTTSPADFAAFLDTEARAATHRQEAAGKLAEQAQQHAAEAERLDAERAAAATMDDRHAHNRIATVRRDVGQQIRDARKAAIDAVRDGDPLAAWLHYRRLHARLKGEWDAMASAYERATGHKAPGGPLISLDWARETFAQFLDSVLNKSMQEVYGDAHQTTMRQIEDAREG